MLLTAEGREQRSLSSLEVRRHGKGRVLHQQGQEKPTPIMSVCAKVPIYDLAPAVAGWPCEPALKPDQVACCLQLGLRLGTYPKLQAASRRPSAGANYRQRGIVSRFDASTQYTAFLF